MFYNSFEAVHFAVAFAFFYALPGIIESGASAQAFTSERIRDLVPMKRAGTPLEVAQLVAFLASEKAAYISGQVIGINGGLA